MTSGDGKDLVRFSQSDNFWKDRKRAIIRTSSCSYRRDALKYVFADPETWSSKFDPRSINLKIVLSEQDIKIPMNWCVFMSWTWCDHARGCRYFLSEVIGKSSILLYLKNKPVLTSNIEIREKNTSCYFLFVRQFIGKYFEEWKYKIRGVTGVTRGQKSISRSPVKGH